nr:MAG TPA: hypothetical protein [Caudoviricetes sp.]
MPPHSSPLSHHSQQRTNIERTSNLHPTNTPQTLTTQRPNSKFIIHNSKFPVLSQHSQTPYFCRIFIVNKLVVSKRQHSND